ncbi:MAG: helix-turn-helix transcriptional regulator [Kiritimatiellae bacterium]|nr:helix-turn-helix transcriptional regulator [Kiritimatiellia bacterium]
MERATPITKLFFEDAGVCGLGRVSAATRQTGGTGVGRRRIDCFALVYTMQGAGTFGQAHGPSIELVAGDAFLLCPGVVHHYAPTAGQTWDQIYMLFEGSIFELWQLRGVLDVARPLYHLEPVSYWESRIEKVWQEEASTLERVIRLQGLLADMNRARDERDVDQSRLKWLKKARRLIAERAADPEAATLAARELGMGYQTFRKTFSRLQGCGPARYRTQALMEDAARRLVMESTPIKQIAVELGFCDEFHFSRRFKQILEASPAAYRRRM